MEVSGQLSVPAALPPGKDPPVPTVWVLCQNLITIKEIKLLLG